MSHVERIAGSRVRFTSAHECLRWDIGQEMERQTSIGIGIRLTEKEYSECLVAVKRPVMRSNDLEIWGICTGFNNELTPTFFISRVCFSVFFCVTKKRDGTRQGTRL
jgi:hypothetical protein